jgi:hypothetical protein
VSSKIVGLVQDHERSDFESREGGDMKEHHQILMMDGQPVGLAKELTFSTSNVSSEENSDIEYALLMMRTTSGLGLYSPMEIEDLDMFIRNMTKVRERMIAQKVAREGGLN